MGGRSRAGLGEEHHATHSLQRDVSGVRLPKGCDRQAFVHIGYADAAEPRDLYGHLGPVIAAARLERTLVALEKRGCTGWMAYSEGVFDDVNKAIVAKLSAGLAGSADEALQSYVADEFGVNAEAAAAWSKWLREWGLPYDRDANAALAELKTLKAGKPSWRLRQWELKTELLRHHRAAAAEVDSPARAAARAAIDAVQEILRREVYALGPQRFIFARNFSPIVWQRALPTETRKEA